MTAGTGCFAAIVIWQQWPSKGQGMVVNGPWNREVDRGYWLARGWATHLAIRLL